MLGSVRGEDKGVVAEQVVMVDKENQGGFGCSGMEGRVEQWV